MNQFTVGPRFCALTRLGSSGVDSTPIDVIFIVIYDAPLLCYILYSTEAYTLTRRLYFGLHIYLILGYIMMDDCTTHHEGDSSLRLMYSHLVLLIVGIYSNYDTDNSPMWREAEAEASYEV